MRIQDRRRALASASPRCSALAVTMLASFAVWGPGCTPLVLPSGQDVTIHVSAADSPGFACQSGVQHSCDEALAADLDRLKLSLSAALDRRDVAPEDRRLLEQRLATLEFDIVRLTGANRVESPAASPSALEQTTLSILRVGVRPGMPPATVYLGSGPALGKTPLSIPVRPGTHRLRLEWPDGRVSEQRVLAHRGSTTLIRGE